MQPNPNGDTEGEGEGREGGAGTHRDLRHIGLAQIVDGDGVGAALGRDLNVFDAVEVHGDVVYAPTGRAATSAAAVAAGDPIACTDASVAAASATSSLRNMAIFGLSTTSGRPSR